jgi:uncharacterized membrane protein YoaK (UPF0700 family)
MPRAAVRNDRKHAPLAVALTLVGGFVDGAGFLVLNHLFTAHMSGNTTTAGVRLGETDWSEAFRAFFPIPLFIVGVALGAAAWDGMTRRGFRPTFAVVLGSEALLLALFTAWGSMVSHTGVLRTDSTVEYYALAALPALAMGMQNAALPRIGRATIRTTFVTGTLTSVGEGLVAFLFWFSDRTRGRSWRRHWLALRLLPRHSAGHRMLILFVVWFGYLAGAAVGAVTQRSWGVPSFLVPVSGLALLSLADAFRLFEPDGRK